MRSTILTHEDGVLDYDEDQHKYWLDGQPIPSVSQLLKGDYPFRGKPGFANRGTAIHAATIEAEAGMIDLVPDEIRGFAEQWLRVLTLLQASSVSFEAPVFSRSLWYAGRFDRMLLIGGELVLIDIKSGSKAASHPIQLAGYAHAWHELKRPIISRYMVIYIKGESYSIDEVKGPRLAEATQLWREITTKQRLEHLKAGNEK